METTIMPCWITTHYGRQFNLLEPTVDQIRLEDIAHALAYICRFNGHCSRFYSVAEHCIRAARLVPREHKLAVLLHDAQEAYIGDMSRPLKRVLPDYQKIEEKLSATIYQKFGLDYNKLDFDLIKWADDQMAITEAEHLMPNHDGWVKYLEIYTPASSLGHMSVKHAKKVYKREVVKYWKGV